MQSVTPCSLIVEFEQDSLDGPSIIVYGAKPDGEVVLLDAIAVGPFPDWESLARRVMRTFILEGKRLLR